MNEQENQLLLKKLYDYRIRWCVGNDDLKIDEIKNIALYRQSGDRKYLASKTKTNETPWEYIDRMLAKHGFTNLRVSRGLINHQIALMQNGDGDYDKPAIHIAYCDKILQTDIEQINFFKILKDAIDKIKPF